MRSLKQTCAQLVYVNSVYDLAGPHGELVVHSGLTQTCAARVHVRASRTAQSERRGWNEHWYARCYLHAACSPTSPLAGWRAEQDIERGITRRDHGPRLNVRARAVFVCIGRLELQPATAAAFLRSARARRQKKRGVYAAQVCWIPDQRLHSTATFRAEKSRS